MPRFSRVGRFSKVERVVSKALSDVMIDMDTGEIINPGMPGPALIRARPYAPFPVDPGPQVLPRARAQDRDAARQWRENLIRFQALQNAMYSKSRPRNLSLDEQVARAQAQVEAYRVANSVWIAHLEAQGLKHLTASEEKTLHRLYSEASAADASRPGSDPDANWKRYDECLKLQRRREERRAAILASGSGGVNGATNYAPRKEC